MTTRINYNELTVSNLTAVRVNVKSARHLSTNDLALLTHFEKAAKYLK